MTQNIVERKAIERQNQNKQYPCQVRTGRRLRVALRMVSKSIVKCALQEKS